MVVGKSSACKRSPNLPLVCEHSKERENLSFVAPMEWISLIPFTLLLPFFLLVWVQVSIDSAKHKGKDFDVSTKVAVGALERWVVEVPYSSKFH
jgi:hypothetical protein